MPKTTIRPAREADILAFYERLPGPSIRAWVLEMDGEVVGVSGWYGVPRVVFSDVREGVPKMTIWRAAKAMMAKMDKPAVCQGSEGSRAMLERLGWQELEDEVFTWQACS